MQEERPKKRLIISLLTIFLIFIYILFAILIFVPSIGLNNLPELVKVIFLIILFGIPLVLTFLVFILVISIIRGKDFFLFKKVRLLAIKILYPFILLLGNILKIDIDKIRSSFIEINNSLLKSYKNKFNREKTIILLPHCIQNSECKYKITYNINNCIRCGKCEIKDIIELCEKYKVFVGIATGGTMARKIVREKKPDFIIAVACERDLASGIHDSYPLPVYGITNDRPNGPCFNTNVSLDKLKFALDYFLKK